MLPDRTLLSGLRHQQHAALAGCPRTRPHLTDWYTPQPDGLGGTRLLVPSEQECGACFKAHVAYQLRKGVAGWMRRVRRG